MSVQGTLSVSGTPVLLNFSSSAQSQENGSLASMYLFILLFYFNISAKYLM